MAIIFSMIKNGYKTQIFQENAFLLYLNYHQIENFKPILCEVKDCISKKKHLLKSVLNSTIK